MNPTAVPLILLTHGSSVTFLTPILDFEKGTTVFINI